MTPFRPRSLSARWRAATLLPLALALTGCVDRDLDDLQAYTDSVLSREATVPTPVCALVDCAALAPEAAWPDFEGRSPFDPFPSVAARPPVRPKPMPDPHPTEALEAFPLDSLRLLGTLQHDGTRWALVRDPDGVVHRLRSGNYLGRNNGKVLHVAEDRLLLSEIVWSDAQGWEDRAAEMALRGG